MTQPPATSSMHSSPPSDVVDTAVTAQDSTPLFHPERPRLKKRPLKALYHFRELIKNKENTEAVFEIFRALPSNRQRRRLIAFMSSEEGRALRAREPYLPPLLDDHERLRQFSADSVAAAYVEFMESQNISAAGLVAEYKNLASYDDLVEWYISRNRDTHDLAHVLTGYSRDALGELCVLAFTHGQSGGLGYLLIAYAGSLHVAMNGGEGAPVLRAVREAQRNGRQCRSIPETRTMDLLAMPLEEAREMIGIKPPQLYNACHAHWRARGIDPFTVMAPENSASEPNEAMG